MNIKAMMQGKLSCDIGVLREQKKESVRFKHRYKKLLNKNAKNVKNGTKIKKT